MEYSRGIKVKIWGDYACFTQPGLKVERVSYPMITPSAARGALEAIFWKPEFRYEVRKIGVLRLGSQMSILRNELSDRQGDRPVFIEDQRQQRSSLVLKGVSYLIHAEIALRRHTRDEVGKYLDQFNRRVGRGQCHHTPYLGTREFAASFCPADSTDEPEPIDLHFDSMLFEIAYVPSDERRELEFLVPGPDGSKKVSGYTQPMFFPASLVQGWLHILPEKYQELYRLEETHAK
jgi:CRISPR-associated protein Cas5d